MMATATAHGCSDVELFPMGGGGTGKFEWWGRLPVTVLDVFLCFLFIRIEKVTLVAQFTLHFTLDRSVWGPHEY